MVGLEGRRGRMFEGESPRENLERAMKIDGL